MNNGELENLTLMVLPVASWGFKLSRYKICLYNESNICLVSECDSDFYVYNESNVILINLVIMLLNIRTNASVLKQNTTLKLNKILIK